jgi:hypothetical protein
LKLDLAAVDATDWAMDGTVSWAKRDDGRPDLTGTPLGAAAGAGAEGLEAITFTEGLAFVSATTGAVLAGVALGSGFTAGALAVGVFAAGFLACTGLSAGAILTATGAFTAGVVVRDVFLESCCGAVGAGASAAPGLAFFVAAAVFTGADAGLDGFAPAFGAVAALGGVALFVLAFTFRLLTETLWVWLSGDPFPAVGARPPGPSARECTGIPKGKPIICNSVTSMASAGKVTPECG